MKDLGHTDYLVFVHRFKDDGTIGEMDSFYSAWSTRHPDGFSDTDIAALRRLVPALGLAIKSAALARISSTLVDVYLGRDAGQRVLSGRIQRGVADRIDAVLWFSDLRSFTTITDTARPRRDHPAAQRLRRRRDHRHPGGRRRRAEADRRRHAGDLPSRRSGRGLRPGAQGGSRDAPPRPRTQRTTRAEERPTTLVYVGLHVGEVFYGNIGSVDRLDFTVVGPAVNETSRIASMCRSVDRPVLISSSFAEALPDAERAKSRVGRTVRSARRRPRQGAIHARSGSYLARPTVKFPRAGLRRLHPDAYDDGNKSAVQ